MPFGLLVLIALAALILFGLAHRVLDRMRLTDTQALVIIGLMIVGGYLNIPLGRGLQINAGGALVPLGVVIYLLVRAGTARERWRAVLAAVAAGVAVILVNTLFPGGPHGGERMLIDPLWLTGIVSGIIGYLAGRSRRAAFVAGVGGVLLSDVYNLLRSSAPAVIGGAGIYDQVVLAGVVAVGLAELVGETRERLQGGPELGDDRPVALHQDEGVADSGMDDTGKGEPSHE